MERRLTAILAADIVDYSKLMGDDQTGTLDALQRFRSELFEPLVTEFRGTVIKRMGDGWIVEFASVTDAVTCALQVQENLVDHEVIRLRIGIHIGDVIFEDEDVFGDGVNIAARLETLANPGDVLISDSVYNSLDNKTAGDFGGGDARQLKNIARTVNVWRWPAAVHPGFNPTQDTNSPSQDQYSIAVLPFDNMSGDSEQEYFADGISEDLITDLSKIASLFVIARNSSFVYKGKSVDIPTIARELGVRYILEGSVRRGGNRIRITAQLIDSETGGHLWAERYDRDLTDIFAVQDEVTANIVRALSVSLGEEEERLVSLKVTDNVAAYEHVLRAREMLLGGQQEHTNEIKEILEQAIELDAQLGIAYAYLALAHLVEWVNGWSEDPEASRDIAHGLARKSVKLTPDDAHAHIALGSVFLALRRHDDAISEAERAIQLFPSYAHGLFELGWYLQYAGRAAESLEYFDRAVRLDPHHADMFLHFMAQAYFQLGRYEEAAELLRRRLVRNPRSDSSRFYLAACYGYLDNADAAGKLWDEIREINPDFSIEQRRSVLPYKHSEDFDQIVTGLQKAGLCE